MKKKTLLLALALMSLLPISAQRVSEKLNRSAVAVSTKTGILVSWRSLNTDGDATFKVLRNNVQIASSIKDVTNYLDADGKAGDTYKVVSSLGDESTAHAWSNMYTTINIPRPSSIKSGNTTGRYRPDDMSLGDVDGDGNYELIVKWMPDNARDNGSNGYSSPCILDCYKIDLANNTTAKQLWRINLGLNIRTGNHYTQFLVYDFDGDGKAEMICKTAPGSKDGKGNYVSLAGTDAAIKAIDNTPNYVNGNGHVTGGEELLTVFNGETGAAMHTVWYNPNRAFGTGNSNMNYGSWGDTNQNRGNRHNACVAYLDGLDHLPSAIMQRGYYTRQYLWAVDWNGTQLTTRWLHRGTSATAWDVVDASNKVITSGSGKSSYGQGVHGISVGDVDEDGKDEICIGSATIDHDGKLLCSTGFGHGDAIHLGKLIPGRKGLQVMMPHEEKVANYGYDVHDAATGEVIVRGTSDADNGRGVACDFIPANPGWEFWSSADNNSYSCTDGNIVIDKKPDSNFRIYWTGDPYDQTFDGRMDSNTKLYAPRIRTFNSASGNIVTFQEFKDYGAPQAANYTKATPCLQADFLGDWREELIMMGYEADYSASTCQLMIFSTPEPTAYKVPCLMQDHVYRMGIVWQNSSYNQPPHLGYDLPASLGIDGKTYKTHTVNNAPQATPVEPPSSSQEALKAAAEDKKMVIGTCYTAGEAGELTASTSNGYIKIRTNNNGETITFSVNPGYVITGITIEGYSNNTSTTADRSITLTGIHIDGSEASVLPSSIVLPGGTKGQTPVTASADGFEAKKNIVLTFDNSLITSSDIDASGKNKQIFAKITFQYSEVSTGITHTTTLQDGCIYNINGQRLMSKPEKGLYILNGKKYSK